MTYKRSILLQVLTVVLVSSVLLFPAAGLKSSLAQGASYNSPASASVLADAEPQSSAIALAEGIQCPANTIGYWKLDETSGSTYVDSHDGHNAGCAGACPSPTTGQVDGGQAFDGTTMGINIPAHSDFDWASDDSFSIELWMQRSGEILRNQVVVGRDDTPTTSLHWWVGMWKDPRRRGLPVFYLVDTGGTAYSVLGTTFLTDGAWHHVVAVRDQGQSQLRIYVDGALEGTTEAVSYTAGFGSPTAGVNIGWIDRTGTEHGYRFGGVADEVAILGTAMTDAQVAEHYARGRAGWGLCSSPSIAVEKAADPETLYVGETAVYSYTVTNDGDIALLNVNVSDDTCSPVSGPQGGDGDAELEPAEVWSYTCSMALSADTTNIVTASGTYTYPVSDTTIATDTLTVDVIDPDVLVDKTPNPAIVYPGTTITYTYSTTNQGTDTLSSVAVSDDQCDPVTTVVGDDTLSPSETQTYACSMVVSTDITNTATFVGTDLLGATWTFTDYAFVDVIAPMVTVQKTADPAIIYAGGTVTYTYMITNDGSDTLENVGLVDDKCAPVNLVGSNDGNLDPGEVLTYECQTTLSRDTDNTATFTGDDLLGTTWTYTDTASVNAISPQIAVNKTPSSEAVYSGETVVYTYTVRNPGDDPLSAVTIEDNKCSPVNGPQPGDDANSNDRLDPGETWTYLCSAVIDESTLNRATVSGTDSLGGTLTAQDTAFVTVISPGISVQKTASKSTVEVGEIVTYNYKVWASGDDPLSNVTVGDVKCIPVEYKSGDTNGNDLLDLGEEWIFACSRAHSEPGETTNRGIANGYDSAGRKQTTFDDETVTVVLSNYLIYLPTVLR